MIKAFDKMKYENIETKFTNDYFKIPYTSTFQDVILNAKDVPTTNRLRSLRLRDKISTLQPYEFRNEVALFGNFNSPLWKEFDSKLEVQMKITLKILSYAFHFHKARILLKRISRSGYLVANLPLSQRFPAENEEGLFDSLKTEMLDGLIRKTVEIPVFSNNSIVVRGFVDRQPKHDDKQGADYEFDKFYKISEKIDNIEGEMHQDIIGLRSLYAIKNIHQLKKMRKLILPYAFSPLSYDQDQQEDILKLIKSDVLRSLSFQVKYESKTLTDTFEQLKYLKNLEDLQLNVQVKDTILKIINKSLNREVKIKNLDIVFCQEATLDYAQEKKPDPVQFDIKFPLYLKHLKKLSLSNICDKNFTETMFDMASQSKLKSLSLVMINDSQSLPNFAEAIGRFTALERLHLSKVQYNKINQNIFLDFISTSNLRVLSLDSINFTDTQFKSFLQKINESYSL